MLNEKKGEVSFGAIVAFIGSILIGVGFAWLIAQNWHQISAPFKIIILLGVTSGAYVTGTLFKLKEYQKIGSVLYVLGALLFALSIFLTAQVFFMRSNLQGMAWLWLIVLVGTIVLSYLFNSYGSLIIAFIEMIIWLVTQFFAFEEYSYGNLSLGILALYFLGMGCLLYGFKLIHDWMKHNFVKIYQWWTVFYFLIFTYILSFQVLLPRIWLNDGVRFGIDYSAYPKEAILFLVFLFVLGLIVLIAGIVFTAKDKKAFNKKEIIGVALIIILLFILIFSTKAVTGILGACNIKSCEQITNIDTCSKLDYCEWKNNSCGYKIINCEYTEEQACSLDKGCVWITTSEKELGNYCTYKSCDIYNIDKSTYKDKSKCEKDPKCKWTEGSEGYEGYCSLDYCGNYVDQVSCQNAPKELICSWNGENCVDVYGYCNQYFTQDSCAKDNLCYWGSSSFDLYPYNKHYPVSLWLEWILINLFFLGLILSVIAYGYWQKKSSIINLGIIFFALNIITRYIGFILDFKGYLGLSLIFITGGIILVVGGWLIERWRRKLVKRTLQK